METMIDPEWAWAEFKPDAEAAWNLRTASHLFRRAGFGATQEELTSALSKTPVQVVDDLLAAQESDAFLLDMKSLAESAIATGNVQQLSAWWAYRMLSTNTQLKEKTTLFWHGHFATGADKVTEPALMLTQNELLRSFAFGEFSALLHKFTRAERALLPRRPVTTRALEFPPQLTARGPS